MNMKNLKTLIYNLVQTRIQKLKNRKNVAE